MRNPEHHASGKNFGQEHKPADTGSLEKVLSYEPPTPIMDHLRPVHKWQSSPGTLFNYHNQKWRDPEAPAQLMFVMGKPGSGKTSVISELMARADHTLAVEHAMGRDRGRDIVYIGYDDALGVARAEGYERDDDLNSEATSAFYRRGDRIAAEAIAEHVKPGSFVVVEAPALVRRGDAVLQQVARRTGPLRNLDYEASYTWITQGWQVAKLNEQTRRRYGDGKDRESAVIDKTIIHRDTNVPVSPREISVVETPLTDVPIEQAAEDMTKKNPAYLPGGDWERLLLFEGDLINYLEDMRARGYTLGDTLPNGRVRDFGRDHPTYFKQPDTISSYMEQVVAPILFATPAILDEVVADRIIDPSYRKRDSGLLRQRTRYAPGIPDGMWLRLPESEQNMVYVGRNSYVGTRHYYPDAIDRRRVLRY